MGNPKFIPYETIVRATSSDPEAVDEVGKSDVSQSLYNLKDAVNMLNFLQTNNIMDNDGA